MPVPLFSLQIGAQFHIPPSKTIAGTKLINGTLLDCNDGEARVAIQRSPFGALTTVGWCRETMVERGHGTFEVPESVATAVVDPSKPLVCPVCQKHCSSPSGLTLHRKTHGVS